MKVLAIDIGAGTQDILFLDTDSNIHNAVKLILPSPSRIYAKKIEKLTREKQDIFLKGCTIGGGAITKAVKKHLKSGHRIYVTEEVAYTFRNHLDEVKSWGIEIVDESFEESFNGTTLSIHEVWLEAISNLFTTIEEPLEEVDFLAVAVQDHGIAPDGVSDRQYRISTIKEVLKKTPYPWGLAFFGDEVPNYYPRMKSIVSEIEKFLDDTPHLVMDTSAAAILGALQDENAKRMKTLITCDIGNSHTMAAVISEDKIIALAEHHTGMLTKTKLEQMFIKLADGTLNNKEIFQEGGHGMFYLSKPVGIENIEGILITGPNRNLIKNSSMPIYFAAPYGDMMITGPVGLLISIKKRFKDFP